MYPRQFFSRTRQRPPFRGLGDALEFCCKQYGESGVLVTKIALIFDKVADFLSTAKKAYT